MHSKDVDESIDAIKRPSRERVTQVQNLTRVHIFKKLE